MDIPPGGAYEHSARATNMIGTKVVSCALAAVAVTSLEARQMEMPGALNVPSEALPAGCQLSGSPSVVREDGRTVSGLWSDFRENPWAGSDRAVVARIYSRVFGVPPMPDGPPLGIRQANAFAIKAVEHIESAYAAFYVGDNSTTVTHVYSLRFKDRNDLSSAMRKSKSNNVFAMDDIVVRVSAGDACSDAVAGYFSRLSKK